MYDLYVELILWAWVIVTGGLLVARWNTPLRIPLAVFLIAFTMLRLWARAGSLTAIKHGHFRFDGAGLDGIRELSEIALIVPISRAPKGAAVLVALRPFWQRPLLITSIPDDIMRSWARGGVRVVGMSPSELADDDRADAFFDSDLKR